MTEQTGHTGQPASGEAEAAETAAGASGSAGAGAPAGSTDSAGADSGDAVPTIDNFAEISGPDRRTEEDKLPPVPGADGGATDPHPGGSPV